MLRVMESLRLEKTSKLIKSSLWPNPPGQWNHSTKCRDWPFLEHFLGCWLQHFPEQPVAMLDSPFIMWTVSVYMHSAVWRGLRVFSLGRINCSPTVPTWVGSIRNEVEEKLQVSVPHLGWMNSWITKKKWRDYFYSSLPDSFEKTQPLAQCLQK